MIYSVEAFDKEDESLAFEIVLPEGYNLNDAQLSNIEALTNKCFKNEKYIFQLTCNVS